MNGQQPFVIIRINGWVLSEKAVKEIGVGNLQVRQVSMCIPVCLGNGFSLFSRPFVCFAHLFVCCVIHLLYCEDRSGWIHMLKVMDEIGALSCCSFLIAFDSIHQFAEFGSLGVFAF